MTPKEQFKDCLDWKTGEYNKCDCTRCDRKNCIHRGAYRRLPRINGGLALCPNLNR